MSHESIRVTNITVLDNPSSFEAPFKFEITFECVEELDNGNHPRFPSVAVNC